MACLISVSYTHLDVYKRQECVHSGVRTAFMTSDCSGTVLERPAREGESPVGETEGSRAESRVPRDTRNLVGMSGDHPVRRNTS